MVTTEPRRQKRRELKAFLIGEKLPLKLGQSYEMSLQIAEDENSEEEILDREDRDELELLLKISLPKGITLSSYGTYLILPKYGNSEIFQTTLTPLEVGTWKCWVMLFRKRELDLLAEFELTLEVVEG